MKKYALILAATLALSGTAFAGVPVTVIADVPAITNQIETMAKWKAQYDQMVSQINQMKQQYDSVTGSRGLGQIMNNPALRDYLPSDWQKVYDSVRTGGYNGLSGSAAAIYDANKVFDACGRMAAGAQRTACEAAAVKPAQDKAFAGEAYAAAKSRLDQINSLMGQINQTQDPKAIAELQGRIASEQAMIANEQTKLQLFQMMAQADEKLHEQRQREINAKQLARRGYLDLQPLTFN
ncbi:P-type DNA transfer protein VirB5 [Xanthomonas vasicola]|uniref:Type IV secretion protein VirB5 n=3 Tax=Xanthomonas vasicola TaxID=56459 RepID=A0A836ZUI5_XANVA|nr:P-type DNA transfer protein VirB5 [Xanthomonas vasicola]KFA30049.1 type IV secretion protein VirB5 [Xanthomonas vasicola pv. vasculorum NCPPB 1326]MBV6748231.1 P-type DNA transfer protein VirB5 [Xanthomonas vasicola pv. vasculorum NCPPB 890]MBV6893866.1 P-type DNA transfer protein VirB5 [Xanthomonas vasicola pv. vasculorum]MDO6949561.1 P-type DNA transfer protein VirB5 [Xanthomonas vasicola]MDO6961846.1 P-type DNA transfer protein VirB5 [Xanthomonas vasicola]